MTGRNPLSYPCGSAAHRRGEHPSWEGCVLPDPPRGRGLGARASGIRSGMGKPGFPTPPRRGLIFTLAIHAARAAHRRGEHPSWEGCALPDPPAGGGMGKPGFPMPLRGGGVGKPGFPTPSSRAYVHVSRPCGCAAQRRNEPTVVPGRAAPSQTLPRVGAWGNPVSPCPSSRAYVHVRYPWSGPTTSDEHGGVGKPGSPILTLGAPSLPMMRDSPVARYATYRRRIRRCSRPKITIPIIMAATIHVSTRIHMLLASGGASLIALLRSSATVEACAAVVTTGAGCSVGWADAVGLALSVGTSGADGIGTTVMIVDAGVAAMVVAASSGPLFSEGAVETPAVAGGAVAAGVNGVSLDHTGPAGLPLTISVPWEGPPVASELSPINVPEPSSKR